MENGTEQLKRKGRNDTDGALQSKVRKTTGNSTSPAPSNEEENVNNHFYLMRIQSYSDFIFYY